MATTAEFPTDGERDVPPAPADRSRWAPEPEELDGFRERIRRFAARRLGNWGAAEDVVQEALRRALEASRAGRIESSAALPGFLFQTALHVCMHRARSASRQTRAFLRYSGAEIGDAESPLEVLISAQRQGEVRRVLGQLEPTDRRILEMTYGDDLDSQDIGRQLGITAGAVRVRRHRAIRRMAERLGAQEKAPSRGRSRRQGQVRGRRLEKERRHLHSYDGLAQASIES